MKKISFIFTVFLTILLIDASCQEKQSAPEQAARGIVDSIGFATKAWQMDSIIKRIKKTQEGLLKQALSHAPQTPWKMVISPHDDYTYVGYLYPAALSGIKARTVIIFGVAHKAKKLGLENQIIFDGFPQWRGPYGPVKVSSLRRDIIERLDKRLFQVNDKMQAMEHSVEAEIPFLQYFDRNVQIISILVPYMSFEHMQKIAENLADAIFQSVQKRHWQWGKDYAILISNDAVHYGDKDWGGKNFARFGSDQKGYNRAVAFEHRLIEECLSDTLSLGKIKKFIAYTVQKENFRKYKWTWCGRYSVPFGLLTGFYLQQKYSGPALNGRLLGYATSLDHAHLPVEDLHMGVTAPANLRHWVGYVGMAYK